MTITGVSVTDDNVDGLVVCDVTTLLPGDVATCTASHTVTQADLNAGFVTNNASATGTPAGGILTDPSDTATAFASASPSLTLDKTIIGGDPYTTVGATIDYQYVVTNTGNVTITGVSVTDDNVDGLVVCDVTTLLPGDVATCTASHTVTQADLNAGFVTNNASATGTPAGGILTDPSDTATAFAAIADLEVSKSVDISNPSAGGTVVYTITVTNNGLSNATGVVVNDLLPAGLTFDSDDGAGAYDSGTGVWTIGGLANGASVTLEITATVDSGTDGDLISNTASVDGNQYDNDSANDSDSADITVKANQAPLTITGPTSATFGGADQAITTSGGSGTGLVTFSAGASTACSIVANQLHVTSGTGTCSITATKAGDNDYNPTTSVPFTVTINKANQAPLTITGPTSATFGGADQAITTSGGSGTGLVTFSAGASTACSIVANQLHVTSGTGTCSITATKAGDNDYNPTTSVPFTVTINKANQAPLTITGPTSATFGGADQAITTSGGSGTGGLTFSAGASTACSIVANQLHVTSGTGTCSITATKAGDDDYNPTTSVPFTVTINKASSTTTVTCTGTPFTYDGTAHGCTAAVTGVGGLNQPVSVSYSGRNSTVYGPSATAPTNAGDYTASATFGGDLNHSGSSNSADFVINKSSTTTSLTQDSPFTNYGQSVTFTATVASVLPGGGVPSGSVQFKDGPTIIGTVALDGAGQAQLVTSSLAVGGHSITATYAATSNYLGSVSGSVSHSVFQAGTTTTITGVNLSTPTVVGQSYTVSFTVTSADGTPSGSVLVSDGTNLCLGGLSGGSGSCVMPSTSVGVKTLTAQYLADSSYSSSSASASHTVNAANTTTSVSSSLNPSISGNSVTFTATVTATAPGSGTPAGSVDFKDGATTIGTGTLNGSGVATFVTSSLTVGSHSITAVYGGNASYNTSTSGTVTQVVNPASLANSTTTLTSSLNPSTSGNSVTFTATVTGGSGTPTGTVTFKDGAATIGTGTLNGSGVATFATSSLTVGSHSITAVYGGNGTYNGSTSNTVVQVVKANSTTTLTSSLNPSTSGQSVTFTATVTGGSGTPTGSVDFKDGATIIGTGTLNGSGVATFATTSLTVASHNMTAVYNGSGTYNASTSNTVVQVVNAAPSSTLAISDVTQAEGNSGTSTFSFTVTRSGSTTGTTNVNFATAAVSATAGASCAVGVDYVTTSGSLSFTAGQTTKTISVTVCGDTAVEPNETFNVNLSGVTGGTITDAQGVGTITNDDVAPATLAISDVTQAEGNSGTSTFSFTVTRSGSTTGTTNVNFATAAVSATAGASCAVGVDYVTTSGSLSFTAGQTTKTISVTVCGDTAVEPNETFNVNLSGVTGGTITDAQGVGTITNDDVAPATLAISDVTQAEGNSGTSTFSFTVTRSGSTTGTTNVNFATAAVSATAGASCAVGVDYVTTSGSLSFTAGQTTKTISVTVCGDTTVEPNETFNVNLSGVTGGTITDAQGVGTITNDDVAPATLAINDVTQAEGNSGTSTFSFTVTRSGSTTGTTNVNFATAAVSATAGASCAVGVDYVTTSGSLSFTAGQTTKTISVTVCGDTAVEPNETFNVNLSGVTGGTITDAQGVGTITNDDVAPATLAISDVTQAEGNSGTSTFSFTVTRSGSTTGTTNVNFATAAVSATAGAGCAVGVDYVTTSGSLSFTAGQTTKTISVTVCGDTAVEPNETFNVNLSGVTGGTITDAQGVGTITNDDVAPKIIFMRSTGGDFEIYVMNQDGTGQTAITSNSAFDGWPSWSPDHTRIAFVSDRDGNNEIYTMNADGSNVVRRTNSSSDDMSPTWSPDGTKVAWSTNRDGNYEIYTMTVGASGLGTAVTRRTNASGSDVTPEWSPTSAATIAWSTNRDGNYEIYTMDVSGSGLGTSVIRRTNNSSSDNVPAWSPDGTKLVWSTNRDGNYEIYTMAIGASGLGTSVTRRTNNSANDSISLWSPDGTRIWFTTDRTGNSEIFRMDVAATGLGTNLANLTNNSSYDTLSN